MSDANKTPATETPAFCPLCPDGLHGPGYSCEGRPVEYEPATDTRPATVHERGNGLPDVGDYVVGDDGEVYEVVDLLGSVHTGRAGEGSWMRATVRLADWDDVDDDSEPVCSATLAE